MTCVATIDWRIKYSRCTMQRMAGIEQREENEEKYDVSENTV